MWGEYQVLEPVRKDAAGAIYKARHRKLDRVVGLRILPNQLAERPELAKRYRLDVQAAARLVHPHIVTPLDTGRAGEKHFLVMQFVDGESLATLLDRDGPLPAPLSVDCVLQAARGLSYAHQQGIIHGDVRPQNLILDSGGTVRLVEIGFGPSSSAPTNGSSPDARPSSIADSRSDIEQLGHVLRELLTGRPLDVGTARTSHATARSKVTRVNLCDECADAPRELNALFQRMVDPERANRFESMIEVISALEILCRAHRWYIHAANGSAGEANLPEAFRAWRVAQQQALQRDPPSATPETELPRPTSRQRGNALAIPKHGWIWVAAAAAAMIATGMALSLIF